MENNIGKLKMSSYNGWIILNKERGLGSTDAVQKVRRLIGRNNKVGHAGTLDPLAQGVLPIAIGEATKTVQYLMNAQKEYVFGLTWGEERTTGDAEGEVSAQNGVIPTDLEIKQILPQFIGEIMQMPPIYSALKINGQPAYKLARRGEVPQLSQRKIQIEALEFISSGDGVSYFKTLCSKGTYIRSLGVDIARALNAYAYVSFLERTKVGDFLIEDAITLANLEKLVHNSETEKSLLSVVHGLGDILAIEVTSAQAKSLRNGLKIFLETHSQTSQTIAQILSGGILQAMVSVEQGLLKPLRVFNLNSMENIDVDKQ
jgi:tRNA pseudouridine55 synthase